MTRALFRLVAFVTLAAAAPVAAQTRVPAQVTGVAGAEVFLDRGRAHGLADGDTLAVERDGAAVGRLVVVAADETRAVAVPVGAPFALTRGETVALVVARATAPEPPATPAEPPPTPAPPAVPGLLTPATPAPRRARRAPRLTGRLQTGASAFWSETTPEDGEPVGRTFASPFASLRADVTGLPGGARLRLDGRAALPSGDPLDLRLYTASLATDVRPGVRAEVGRFGVLHDRATGFWDGATLAVGSDAAGVGVAAGLQPSRTSGGPAPDQPKAAAYAYASRRSGDVRADVSASAGHLFAGDGASFGGAAAAVAWQRGTTAARLGADLLADEGGAGWGVARASLRASGRAGRLSGQAAVSRYRPSALTSALLPGSVAFAPVARTSATAGVGLRVGLADLRADAGLHRRDGASDGGHVGGGVRLARLPGTRLGASVDATRRVRDGRAALYASALLTATTAGASVTGGYRLTQTALSTGTLTQHGVEASASVPIGRRTGLALSAHAARGGGLTRAGLYTSLWYRL